MRGRRGANRGPLRGGHRWGARRRKEDYEGDLAGTFKDLGQLICEVGALVGQQCDMFGRKHLEGYPEGGVIEEVIRTSKTCKARLLYYLPVDEDNERTCVAMGGCPSLFELTSGLANLQPRQVRCCGILSLL